MTDSLSPEIIEATILQSKGSDPAACAWVGASAGTGKTKILTDRVLRLLVSGAQATRILCLTFTKAGANEMQTRIQQALYHWWSMDRATLHSELSRVMQRNVTAEDVDRAQLLFPLILESQSGLNIMTIHGFCQQLLRQFPREAGLSPYVRLLDERDSYVLIERTWHHCLLNPSLRPYLEIVTHYIPEMQMINLWVSLLAKRHNWQKSSSEIIENVTNDKDALLGALSDYWHIMDAAWQHVAAQFEPILHAWQDAIYHYGTEREQEIIAPIIRKWLALGSMQQVEQERFNLWPDFYNLFWTTQDTPRQRLVTKAILKVVPHLEQELNHIRAWQSQLLTDLRQVEDQRATSALRHLYYAIYDHYQERKKQEAAVDYEDLIYATHQLLSTAPMRQWIRYRLDLHYHHLLIDEAQDTSPSQWRVIYALCEEWLASYHEQRALSPLMRSLFVVGDDKQSIFRFQGAQAKGFDAMRYFFTQQIKQSGYPIHHIQLRHSFRSLPAILTLANALCHDPDIAPSLSETQPIIPHEGLPSIHPGWVWLWPSYNPKTNERSQSHDDDIEEISAMERYAELIVEQIRHWLQHGLWLNRYQRQIQPGDIMILVRRRNRLPYLIVNMLRKNNIPCQGMDRLILLEHPAIRDLIHLMQWCICPTDDTTLAKLLISPLFGLSEEERFFLCHQRSGHLWDRLRHEAKQQPYWAATMRLLECYYQRAYCLPPARFLSHCIYQDGAYGTLMHHYGPETKEALEQFIDSADHHSRHHLPSLRDFLNWLHIAPLTIKRDHDNDQKQAQAIRILTIHGSKGLQAPIVILADTTIPAKPKLVYVEDSEQQEFHLIRPHDKPGPHIASLIQNEKEETTQEYWRLLYVALTRAEEGCLISGLNAKISPEGEKSNHWYGQLMHLCKNLGVAQTMESPFIPPHLSTYFSDQPSYLIGKLPIMDSSSLFNAKNLIEHGDVSSSSLCSIPIWAYQKSAIDEHPSIIQSIAPSRGMGALHREKLISSSTDIQLISNSYSIIGPWVHRLLYLWSQHPSHTWSYWRHRLIEQLKVKTSVTEDIERFQQQATSLETNPWLVRQLLTKGWSEQTITGTILGDDGLTYPVHGVIDRLVIEEDGSLLLIDYKTHPYPIMDTAILPTKIVQQLTLYHRLVIQLFPNKQLETGIFWTETGKWMPITQSIKRSYNASIG
jgi:ATP-dependent helicase/nuclease subunit A